jgi:hypothetical protein
VVKKLAKNLQRLAAADKKSLEQELFENLASHGLRCITKVRKDMKKKLFDFEGF